MLKLKYFTPYLFLLMAVFYAELNISKDNYFVKLIFEHIDYLVTDVKAYNEVEYSETDYSVFSDEMVCRQTSLLKVYPKLGGFLYEAKKRGVRCNHFNLNKIYFYSSLL